MSADTTAAELGQELDRGRRGIVAPYVSGFTPWGPARSIRQVRDGVVEVTTDSRRGYWLSPEMTEAMPPLLRAECFEGAGGSSWVAALDEPSLFELANTQQGE